MVPSFFLWMAHRVIIISIYFLAQTLISCPLSCDQYNAGSTSINLNGLFFSSGTYMLKWSICMHMHRHLKYVSLSEYRRYNWHECYRRRLYMPCTIVYAGVSFNFTTSVLLGAGQFGILVRADGNLAVRYKQTLNVLGKYTTRHVHIWVFFILVIHNRSISRVFFINFLSLN